MTVMLSQEKITYESHDMDTERPCYPYIGPYSGGLIVAKNRRGHIVGHLRWYKEGHEREFMIDMVKVEAPYQRRGIATQLLREAQKIDPRVRHSHIRTEAGDRWAKATGDAVPIRCHWSGRWSASHFDHIVADIRHIIEHEASWEVT